MEIITKSGELPFADLVNNQDDLALVARHMQGTIWNSFNIDSIVTLNPIRPTESETKRRAQMYIKWFGILRRDCQYSLEKTLDMLPHALRCEIDGTPYEPRPAEESWGVSGKGRPMVASLDDDTFKSEQTDPSDPGKRIGT